MRPFSGFLIIATCVCFSLASSAQQFDPPVAYPTGALAPSAVSIGDLNGDGRMDVVAVNSDLSGTVGVLLGNGDGTLRPVVTYPAGAYPAFVVLADFNHDGFLDIAVANRAIGTPGQVNILLGNGDGTFKAPVPYGPFNDAFSIALGDFNGDGNLDIAVGDVSTGSLLLGKSNGTFKHAISIGANAPVAFAVADYNGDGKLDLVSAFNTGMQLQMLLGNGHGKFKLQSTFPVSTPPIALVAGDFNNDGIPDFAVADEAVNDLDSNVTVFESSRSGYLSKIYPYGDEPRCIVATKLSKLGALDLMTSNEFNGTVDVFRNSKTGKFSKPLVLEDGNVVAGYLAVGDLNGDGKTDIVVADGLNYVHVILQK
jgi:FG-GAP-like repeat